LGQQLTAQTVLIQRTTAGDLTLGIENASLTFGDGSSSLVTVTIVSAALVIKAGGVVGALAAEVELAPTLSEFLDIAGTVALAVNTTPPAVQQTVTVGGTDVDLPLAAGALRTQLGATGAPFTFSGTGQSIEAVVTIERRPDAVGSVLLMSLSELGLTLGTPTVGLSVISGSGLLVVTSDGVAGTFTGTFAATIPGVSIDVTP